MSTTNELIYYKKSFAGEHGDFSGPEAALGVQERLEFLKHYSDFQVKLNGLEGGSKQAVERAEIEEALNKIDYIIAPEVRGRVDFTYMNASLLKKNEAYEGWQLYTERASVENGEVVLDDMNRYPLPAACYTFDPEKKLKRISIDVFIGENYRKICNSEAEKYVPIEGTPGRILELRAGIDGVVKFEFYPTGIAYARVNKTKPYHATSTQIGEFAFDEYTRVDVELCGETYKISLNGGEAMTFDCTTNAAPDTFFVYGDTYPRGLWKIRPVKFEYENEVETEFFKNAAKVAYTEETIGEVKLPFGVGTYKNRDKYLILKKTFTAQKSDKVNLILDSLDPGGEALINGKSVLKTDSFDKITVDITDAVKEGENTLELIIEPRCPEVLYPWHRNRDPYIAWFSNEVAIEFVSSSHVTHLEATTKSVKDGYADITLKLGAENAEGKTLNVYMRKSSAEKLSETLIYSAPAGESICAELKVQADAWCVENPAMYVLRAELLDGVVAVDDLVVETGFRTICQKNGDIYLNGERAFISGALIMQFMPPYDNIGKSHVCPTDYEIIWQLAMLKGINANTARLHMLCYGTNDKRYARLADRYGMMLIWTTRYINAVESVQWDGKWWQADNYAKQVEEVKEHPSIIMWEGSNEFHAAGPDVDWLYDQFVDAVKPVDDTRLLSPSSHLYYGGGLYKGGKYYQDDGLADENFNPAKSSYGWVDPLVVRSCHPYDIALGYGTTWDIFRKQDWASQPSLFESKKHSYLVTEIAVIGRHDHTTKECQEYVKNDSYELKDELGSFEIEITQDDWRLSQAHQALAASKTLQLYRARNADGITWCCLSSGANDGSYFKPPIDFYGYAKYAFYAMRENFAKTIAFNENTDVVYGKNTEILPVIVGAKSGERLNLTVTVYDESDAFVDSVTYADIEASEDKISLAPWTPAIDADGYYKIVYSLT